ncbi:MAG: Plug domain-containing protein, partial [Leptospira sp.]|nr:Plug domain-containing protein [Leptospira sp.]
MSENLMADEPVVPVKKTVIIADFAPFDSESSGAINSQIFDSLKDAISAKGYSVEKSNQQTPVDRLSNAKENNIPFLIEGFYQKKSEKTNLNIYAQVYDPATGFIIDAFNISDEIFQGQDLAIDSGDLLEPDSVRIEKFSKKLSQLIRSNSKRKENRENIEQFVINSKISSKNKFALTSGEKATEEATAQVFDLLQNQVTTSATKVAKKTSEAPNIVSVIQQKELQDYGRVSMNDVLYNLPGFAASQINDRRTVSARGMYEGWNNNHLLLLMDGVQFNESFYGSALTWEVTPLNLVKSMEVIRGPGSALYGSNATNGVISLNTFSGEDLKGGYKTRARVGDYGTRIYDLLTGNTGKLFSYVLSYNSYETNGNNYKNYD